MAADLVAAVEEHRDELLAKIVSASHHYLENRINPTDKSILLIAMAEICYFDDIPPVVSVSEAAGLARKYSTETSADFVNGVLQGVIKKRPRRFPSREGDRWKGFGREASRPSSRKKSKLRERRSVWRW